MDLNKLAREMQEWYKKSKKNVLYTEFLESRDISQKAFNREIQTADKEIIKIWEQCRTYEKNRLTKLGMRKEFSSQFINNYMNQEHDWQIGGKSKELTDKDAEDIAKKIGLAKVLKNNKDNKDFDMITEKDIDNLDRMD